MQESKEPSSTMLYVSNLPFTFEDSDLKGVFAGYELVSAYVATRRNGRSKGFGFVTFSNSDHQQKALASIDGKELAGRTLSVKVAHKDDRRDDRGELREEFKTEVQREPRKKRENASERPAERGDRAAAPRTPSETVLYVSNLPFEFTDDDLRKLFAPYKPNSARIATRRTGRSKGFGFVELPNKQEQNNALALDGHMIGERQIGVKISVAADRTGDNADNSNKGNNNANKREGGDRKPKAPANDNNNARSSTTTKKPAERAPAPSRERTPASTEPSDTTVYVSNLPFDLSDEGLAKIFADKGHKCVVARIARRRDDRSKGFGFVEFASHADQQSSLALDGLDFSERAISVKVAKKGSETRGEESAAGEDKPRRAPRRDNNNSNNNNNNNNNNSNNKDREGGERAAAAPKKPSDTLVYVSNLSFDVDDNALAKIFDGLSIKSAHVAVRRNGRSKGFGFVEFASHAEQQKALSKSGTDFVGRTLSVEVANEKQAE